MSLGLCCMYMVEKKSRNGTIKLINAMDCKTLQFGAFNAGKYSDEFILEIYQNNVNNLKKMLKIILADGIKVFRISSELLPLFDIVKESIYNHASILNALKEIGDFVKANNMRLSMHPDQFVVLSSATQRIIDNGVKILAYHNWIFDRMGLDNSPFYAINVHGGARGRLSTLVDTISKLPDNIRGRLTLENDESSYNVKELMGVYNQTGVPCLFDTHHHTFNDAGISIEEGMELALSSWGSIKGLTHLSNTTPGLENGSFVERRKHSDYIHYIPECQRIANNSGRIDIEIEAKQKQLSVMKMVKDFDIAL